MTHGWQDGITAFEALESGVLHPLRELLTWLEGAGAATAGAARAPRLTVVAKVAAELERDAAGALALVPPSSSSSGSNGNGGEEGKTGGANRAAGSVAVLEVGLGRAGWEVKSYSYILVRSIICRFVLLGWNVAGLVLLWRVMVRFCSFGGLRVESNASCRACLLVFHSCGVALWGCGKLVFSCP